MTDKDYRNLQKYELEFYNALDAGDVKKAEKAIRFLRKMDPTDVSYIVDYADLLMNYKTSDEKEKKRKLNKAEVFLIDKINKGLDKSGKISLKLASVWLEMKKYDDVINIINNNYHKFNDDFKKALGFYYLGCAYDNKNLFDAAEKCLKESIKHRKNGSSCVRLMYLYYKQKDYKSSRKLFDVAVKNTDNPQKLYLEDAKFLGKMLKISEAKYKFCLSLAADYEQEDIKKVIELLDKDKTKNAKKVLNNMIDGVNGQFAKLMLAVLYIDERNIKGALELLNTMDIDSGAKSIFTELMVLATISKDKYLYETISCVNENCLEDSPAARIANIKKLRYDGNLKDALKAIEKLNIDEKNTLAVRLQKAKVYQEMLNYEEAEKIYNELLDTDVRRAALCSLCDLYLYIGQVKKAKEFVEYSNDPQIIGKSVSIDICEGRLDVAKKKIKEVINNDIPNKDEFCLLRVSIAIRENDFKTAKYYFDLYNELSEIYKNKNKRKFDDLEYFINYNLGMPGMPNTYFQRQLVSYSKESTIKHISSHMVENSYKQQHSVFNGNFSAEEIYKMTKAKFNIKATHITDKSADVYTINLKVPVAKLGNKETSYVRVVTIANTDKILTIHPIWMVQDSCLVNSNDNGRQRVRK